MFKSIVLIAASLLPGPPAGAAPPAGSSSCEATGLGAAKPLDLAIGAASPGGTHAITVTAHRAALFQRLPTLQEHGVISKNVTTDELDQHPNSSGNVLSLLLTSCAVRQLYATHADLDRTRWTVSLRDPSRELYSFAFNRMLYEHTDWDRSAFTNFPKQAAGFSYNLRFTLDMSRETSGGIDDD